MGERKKEIKFFKKVEKKGVKAYSCIGFGFIKTQWELGHFLTKPSCEVEGQGL